MIAGDNLPSRHSQSSSLHHHKTSKNHAAELNPGPVMPGSKPTKPHTNPNEEFTTRSPAANPNIQTSTVPQSLSASLHHQPPAADLRFPFPESSALIPPPPPTYGFHMLDRRSIAHFDGSVRTYFALPPDYQEFSPPFRSFDPNGSRLLPPGLDGHGLESGGWRRDKMFPPAGSFGPNGSLDHNDSFRHRWLQDSWNSVGVDRHRHGSSEDLSLKRKFGGDEDGRARRNLEGSKNDDFLRQRQQHLLMHSKEILMPNGLPPCSVGDRGEFPAEKSSPYKMGVFDGNRGDDSRSSKLMRTDGGFDNAGVKHHDVDEVSLKKNFLYFAKIINEKRKVYLGGGKGGCLHCVVCGRSSKDFEDVHGLIMHTYNSENPDLRMDHLGLHKALCVLMGWNYLKPPDDSKGYQFLQPEEIVGNQEDLIMWPPMVIIQNTGSRKGKDAHIEYLGNKAVEAKLRDAGFGGGTGKTMSLPGKEGFCVVKFRGDAGGLDEAKRMAQFFEKEKCGRKGWDRAQSTNPNPGPVEDNRDLVESDRKSGQKKRILYGYLGTAGDLEILDLDTRKKVVLESMRDFKPS